MHLVLIAWLYLAGAMALSASSATVGVCVFVIGGVLPVLAVVALLARRVRRRREARSVLEQHVHSGDDRDA
jgi:biotin transporter BioY